MIKNPILKGSYPDPSVCRCGDDYYLVCSSFCYYPGLPIFHSKDLKHWEQIGHVLNRPEQLHITYEYLNMGLFAPTIRYHDGTFYVVCTNMNTHENFLVTAENPAGPWSDLILIPEANGIDPSLFFDDDGKVYFIGTEGFLTFKYGKQAVICAEFDTKTGHFIDDCWPISFGAYDDSKCPEGPHLYKKDGWYYLVIAEGGGNVYTHCATASRSKDIHGPYEQCPQNPILTNRHLGPDYRATAMGHCDLFETQNGEWYGVCLGERQINGNNVPLGRETFLFPVEWQNGWPIACPKTGYVEMEYPDTYLSQYPFPEKANPWISEDNKLGMEWQYLGTPYTEYVSYEDGGLAMKMLPTTTIPEEFEGTIFDFKEMLGKKSTTKVNLPYVARRVSAFNYTASVDLKVQLHGKEAAGVSLMQNNAVQLIFELSSGKAAETVTASVIRVDYVLDSESRIHFEKTVLGRQEIPSSENYTLTLQSKSCYYTLSVNSKGKSYTIAENVDTEYLGLEKTDSFIGIYIGVFATSKGDVSDNKVLFKKFKIKEFD